MHIPKTRRGAVARGPTGLAGFELGRLAGVQVLADWSVLIIFALVVINLGAGVFPVWHRDWSALLRWSTAVGAAVLFMVSLLAHELSHALVAREFGISVPRITLFVFGGMAHMEGEPSSPQAEFLVAIVGPVVSLTIGMVALGLGLLLLPNPDVASGMAGGIVNGPLAALRDVGPVSTLLLWLGPINVVLGLFNLVPGFPLDGGRVLRAALWGWTGNLMRATDLASRAGQIVAWGLMALGAVDVFGGAIAQGFWLLLIGWFLNNAARASLQMTLVQTALAGVPVERVMRTLLDRVTPSLSLSALVHDHLLSSDQRSFPVEENGRLVGLVCIDDVRRVPEREWPSTPVERIMTPAAQLVTLTGDAKAGEALDVLARRDVDQVPIVDGPRLLGMVRRRDLLRFVALQHPQPQAAR